MKRTPRPTGRPPKPTAKKYVRRLLSFPPDVWEQFCDQVGPGDRSAVVVRLVRAHLGMSDAPSPEEPEE